MVGDHARSRRHHAEEEGRLSTHSPRRAQGQDVPAPDAAPEPPFTDLHARRLGPLRRFAIRHPRLLDGLVVLWFLSPVPLATGLPGTDTVAYWLIVAAMCAVLFWRRAAPIPAYVAILALTAPAIALTGDTAGLDLAIAIGVYLITTSVPRPVAGWLATGLAVAVSAGAALLWSSGELADSILEIQGEPDLQDNAPLLVDPRVGVIVNVVLAALIGLAVGTSVRNRREHVQRLLDRANQLALGAEQSEALAISSERARIAREMHDVVAHSLQVMIALSDGARASMTRSPARSEEALDELSATGRAAIADMRRILGVLRAGDEPGADLAPQPGDVDLEHLIGRFRQAGMPVRFHYAGTALPADQGLHLTVFRVVQESLTNVLRYAPRATEIDVRIIRAEDEVSVSVTNDDDGAPPATSSPTQPPTRGAGKGLIGMRERVAVYGGDAVAGPCRGGWRVHVTLPLTPFTPAEEAPA